MSMAQHSSLNAYKESDHIFYGRNRVHIYEGGEGRSISHSAVEDTGTPSAKGKEKDACTMVTLPWEQVRNL